MHPLYHSLAPIIDQFSSQISQELLVAIISPPYIVPSCRLKNSEYPPSLYRYLLSLGPRHDTVTPKPNDIVRDLRPENPPGLPAEGGRSTGSLANRDNVLQRDTVKQLVAKRIKSGSTFLRVPTINMNLDLNMDVMNVRKWSWPGFGKPVSKVPYASDEAQKIEDEKTQDPVMNNQEIDSEEGIKHYLNASGDIDTVSLAEAMDSDDIRDIISQTPPEEMSVAEDETAPEVPNSPTWPDVPLDMNSEPTLTGRETSVNPVTPSSSDVTTIDSEPLTFSSITVHLGGEDPLATYRRRVFYTTAS